MGLVYYFQKFKYLHKFYESLILEPLFFERLTDLKIEISRKISLLKEKDFAMIKSNYPPHPSKPTTSNNAVIYLALYLNYNANNIIDMVLVSLAMSSTWYKKYGKKNPQLISWKRKISKKSSKPFHVIDLIERKLLFSYDPKQ